MAKVRRAFRPIWSRWRAGNCATSTNSITIKTNLLVCFVWTAEGLRMSAGALAKACGLLRTRIEWIASEQTGITADTALRLAKALGTTAQLWLNLQNNYDFQIANRNLGKVLDRIETANKPKAD